MKFKHLIKPARPSNVLKMVTIGRLGQLHRYVKFKLMSPFHIRLNLTKTRPCRPKYRKCLITPVFGPNAYFQAKSMHSSNFPTVKTQKNKNSAEHLCKCRLKELNANNYLVLAVANFDGTL